MVGRIAQLGAPKCKLRTAVEALPLGWIFCWGQSGTVRADSALSGGTGPFLVDRESERLIRTATRVSLGAGPKVQID